jgi:uncharacterized protein YbjQ (UPF0145 family)
MRGVPYHGSHIVDSTLTIWTEMCETARQDSYDIMVRHAQELGANALIAVRHDANEVSSGITEVLTSGTAVIVEPV